MNRLLLTAWLAVSLCMAQQPAGPANAPTPPAPGGRAGGRGAPRNDGVPRENPSNQEVGIDIDRFIGVPTNAYTKVSYGGLMTRSMLRHGDPYHPGPNGAVLEYRDDCALATLLPHTETAVFEAPEFFFFYVQGGEGRLDSGAGTRSYNLHDGSAIILPPHSKQRFISTSEKQLSMIMVTWENNDGVPPPNGILIADSYTKPFGTNRAHWIHMGKSLFGPADGLNTVFSSIGFPAMSYGGPHAHAPGVEELWVKTGSDVGYIILGSEIRKVVGPAAFLSPPNGKTTHSSMNLSEESVATWLYIAHRPPQAAQPAAAAAEGPR